MPFVLGMIGLTLLAVHWVIVYWLIGEYEARIQVLEAQLRIPCRTCIDRVVAGVGTPSPPRVRVTGG
jgi:hypothetical protein